MSMVDFSFQMPNLALHQLNLYQQRALSMLNISKGIAHHQQQTSNENNHKNGFDLGLF
jgi:hypothetical protein